MSTAGMFRFVVAESFPASAIERLGKHGEVVSLPDPSPDALIGALPGTHALLIRARTHVTARIIESATNLIVIGRAATSTDHIDVRAAKRRNIAVVYSPQAGVRSLAEFTVGVILASQRRLLFLDRKVRGGEFESLRDPTAREFRHETLGLLGMSRVAETVASIMVPAFGCRVIYHDPVQGRSAAMPGVEPVSFDALVAESDILLLHLPLNANTRRIIGAEQISRLRPNAILVNTSRGGLVDYDVLAEALKRGLLRGAAIDVFDTEPLPSEHPLRTAPNCILTPHVGALTADAREALFGVVDDVLRVLHGETPHFPAIVESADAGAPAQSAPD